MFAVICRFRRKNNRKNCKSYSTENQNQDDRISKYFQKAENKVNTREANKIQRDMKNRKQ